MERLSGAAGAIAVAAVTPTMSAFAKPVIGIADWSELLCGTR